MASQTSGDSARPQHSANTNATANGAIPNECVVLRSVDPPGTTAAPALGSFQRSIVKRRSVAAIEYN
jgi:hypothetical protein